MDGQTLAERWAWCTDLDPTFSFTHDSDTMQILGAFGSESLDHQHHLPFSTSHLPNAIPSRALQEAALVWLELLCDLCQKETWMETELLSLPLQRLIELELARWVFPLQLSTSHAALKLIVQCMEQPIREFQNDNKLTIRHRDRLEVSRNSRSKSPNSPESRAESVGQKEDVSPRDARMIALAQRKRARWTYQSYLLHPHPVHMRACWALVELAFGVKESLQSPDKLRSILKDLLPTRQRTTKPAGKDNTVGEEAMKKVRK
jgi:hypothetical protein